MPRHIVTATRVEAAGTPPKLIDEVLGRVNTGTSVLSVAHMRSPEGWSEPGQRPAFDELTYVLSGTVLVEHSGGVIRATAGEAVHSAIGEWVRYSTPDPGGAEYIAVCWPAFSPDTVHRGEAS